MARPHALVVGGTGMLRGVSLSLAGRNAVSVVARGRKGLERLRKGSRNVHPLSVDYTDGAALEAALDEAVAARGPFTLAVAWIHSTAPDAPLAVARRVRGRFFHVLGSAAADPSLPDPGRRTAFEALEGVAYREILLGFVRRGARSRWLSNGEIEKGVLGAIATDRPRAVVGVVEPWSARP